MTRRGILMTLIFAVPMAAFAAWWFYTFERTEIEVDRPLRGEARYNPLYALKKTLQAQSIEVAVRSTGALDIKRLGAADVLLLASDVRLLNEANSSELLTWVENGGHLIFALPRSGDGRDGALLEALSLAVVDQYSCLQWRVDPLQQSKTSDPSKHCFSHRFKVDEEYIGDFEWLWGSAADGYLMGRQGWGDGSVFVAADLDFLGNRVLGEPGMSAFAWQVLAPVLGEGKVHLVYDSDATPLHVLLVRRGWPILLPLLLALLGWLWTRSQRFGPLLPLAAPDRRALLEHVRASGEFMFRRGRALSLYAAVQRLIIARLRRRDPALAALEGEALVQALSERFQIAAAAIRQALQPIDLARPDQFSATIRTLMQLRNL